MFRRDQLRRAVYFVERCGHDVIALVYKQMMLIDILAVQKCGTIKYVRLGDQTFRFMEVNGLGSHADLVEPHDMPISAGFIAFDLERDPPLYQSHEYRIDHSQSVSRTR